MSSFERGALLVHVGVTLAMMGLIWFVQCVHYPLMADVGRDGFAQYEKRHQDRTSIVVMPLMLCEAATAVWLVWYRPELIPRSSAWLGLVLVIAIWLSTFFLQVPQHSILSEGFQERAHRLLVQTNWIRTFGWTARGGLVLWMTGRLF